MGTIKSFEEFEIWETAREITRQVYGLTGRKAFAGDFALKNQICRASISIMSNIAEGYESQTENTFIRHLSIAKGSAGEVRSQLYVALDQGYITEAEFGSTVELSKKASRQITRLIGYLKQHWQSKSKTCNLQPETCNLQHGICRHGCIGHFEPLDYFIRT
jgi:four helix bundle protein